jgi:AcrR family transcriptional regulator
VTATLRPRDLQRAAREAAILDAAWSLFAVAGPDGASLRDVAATAGCTHALVTRYFGSKDGLVTAVADRLVDRVGATIDEALAVSEDPLTELLAGARRERPCVQLLIRSALGDVRSSGFPGCLRLEQLGQLPAGRGASAVRARLLAYGAASLVLGWITFEPFLVEATRLGRVPPRRRDAAIAAAAHRLLGLAGSSEPELAPRVMAPPAVPPPAVPPPAVPPRTGPTAPGAREALVRSAVELFAEHGPASVSVREIARHAGVNQGLIYRHFGSKEALLAEAIERAGSSLYPAALAADGFDYDAMSQLMHHRALSPRLIARSLVDDVDLATVRQQFPVIRRMVDGYDQVPTGARPGDLSDPRIAVAAAAGMALGSVIWGRHLVESLGFPDDGRVEAAISDLARLIVGWPVSADR